MIVEAVEAAAEAAAEVAIVIRKHVRFGGN